MPQASKEEGLPYLCVTDRQITDRKLGKTIGKSGMMGAVADLIGDGTLPKVTQMRLVCHVRQKSLDIPEATPIVQEKMATGIAGLL